MERWQLNLLEIYELLLRDSHVPEVSMCTHFSWTKAGVGPGNVLKKGQNQRHHGTLAGMRAL